MQNLILVTGGAGYIGSHTVLALLESGYDVIVLDNFSNSCPEALNRVATIAKRAPLVVQGDVRDSSLLHSIFKKHQVAAAVHFAGLKAVGESVRLPLDYYENNVTGTLQLCRAMADAGVLRLVFSSSATVYGNPLHVPISEDDPVGDVTNPYGRSKFIVEQMLRDLAASDPNWSIALLRYFNPAGGHPSGLMGEDPNGIPNNLLPYVAQVAAGRLPRLSVYGGDYPTHDGTGVRDYIHVLDLAAGHIKSLDHILAKPGLAAWNLGTGRGYSVLEIIRAFEAASGRTVPYEIVARRSGDIAECWANPSKASDELNWKAERNLSEMMADLWCWQKNNPNGYSTAV